MIWNAIAKAFSLPSAPWVVDQRGGCVNDIVCLTWKRLDERKECLSLWNPATREFIVVAYPDMPKADFKIAGFGFDMLSNDFKILRGYMLKVEDKLLYRYEIYSLKTNNWKSLTAPSDVDGFRGTDGYFNGVFYWYSMLKQVNRKRLVIVSFSFSSENFKVSNPPKDACLLTEIWNPLSALYFMQIMVTQYKQSIALLISHHKQKKSTSYIVDLWIVTHFDNCGVPISWQHLLSVVPVPNLPAVGLRVETTLINGDLIFNLLMREGKSIRFLDESLVYKTSANELKKLQKGLFIDYFQYVESLFPLSKRHFT